MENQKLLDYTIDRVLLYYDGPQMFIGNFTNQVDGIPFVYNKKYLFLRIDDHRLLLAETDEAKIDALIKCRITLYSMFESSACLYMLTENHDLSYKKLEQITFNDLCCSFLPDKEAYFLINTKTCFMMIGLPCSGKSHLIKNLFKDQLFKVLSSDSHIERLSREQGLLYNEGFTKVSKQAFREFEIELNDTLLSGSPFILDQTNLSLKSRAEKIRRFKKNGYTIYGIEVIAQLDVHSRLIDFRQDKIIPKYVMDSMRSSYTKPLLSEGFEDIRTFETKFDEGGNITNELTS